MIYLLVIWDVEGPTHVECRKKGDIPVSADEPERIMAEVTLLFRKAGFWRNHVTHYPANSSTPTPAAVT